MPNSTTVRPASLQLHAGHPLYSGLVSQAGEKLAPASTRSPDIGLARAGCTLTRYGWGGLLKSGRRPVGLVWLGGEECVEQRDGLAAQTAPVAAVRVGAGRISAILSG